jgi:hypothetical protein
LGFVDIRKSQPKEARMQFETPVEKIERSARVQKSLAQAIDDYANRHNVPMSVALDKVLLSSSVSEYHRLDRGLRDAERETIAERELAKAQRRSKEAQFNDLVDAHMRQGKSRLQAYRHVIESKEGKGLWDALSGDDDHRGDDVGKGRPQSLFPEMSVDDMITRLNSGSPGDENVVESADAILQRLADVQQQKNPAMSRAEAVVVASGTPEFTAAHRHEKLQKFR